METNQQKVLDIIGEDVYKTLIDNGFIVLERKLFDTFMKHEERFQALEEQLDTLKDSFTSRNE